MADTPSSRKEHLDALLLEIKGGEARTIKGLNGYFVCDKITKLPNVQGFHGIFPDKADPVDTAINYTTRVFCGGEFAIPMPNTGTEDASKYRSMFSCVDAETMEVRWQVLIDGNCDLVATSYDGKLAATNQYNTEMGAKYEDMMSAERDADFGSEAQGTRTNFG